MIVITAASGALGAALADELVSRGKTAGVRLAARSADKLAHRPAQGFETVAADYDDPASLKAAFAGADTAVVISGQGPNEVRSAQHRNAFEAAKSAGVKRIVYTSATNPVAASRFDWAKAHADSESWLTASGLAFTILRDNSYWSNVAELLKQARQSGTLPFPGIAAKVAYVSHADVAGALAGVLLGTGHENRIYEIAGQTAYSAEDLATLLSAGGREVKALDVPPAAFEQQFLSLGWPDWVASGIAGFFAALGAGEYAATSQDTARLSGRPTTTAEQFIASLG